MTAEPAGPPGPARIRSVPGEPYEARFPRYAHNARITASYSDAYAARQRRAAELHDRAAANADSNGDARAAYLYGEMAGAALDAAEALEDLADLARQTAEHYTTENEQERQSS